ncbi:MAG: hypothetical protein AAF004_06205 [Pseudomonadota bacterium]
MQLMLLPLGMILLSLTYFSLARWLSRRSALLCAAAVCALTVVVLTQQVPFTDHFTGRFPGELLYISLPTLTMIAPLRLVKEDTSPASIVGMSVYTGIVASVVFLLTNIIVSFSTSPYGPSSF